MKDKTCFERTSDTKSTSSCGQLKTAATHTPGTVTLEDAIARRDQYRERLYKREAELDTLRAQNAALTKEAAIESDRATYYRDSWQDVKAQNAALQSVLRDFSRLEVKGHSLLDRLQFSDEGRALSARITAALGGDL